MTAAEKIVILMQTLKKILGFLSLLGKHVLLNWLFLQCFLHYSAKMTLNKLSSELVFSTS